MQIILLERIGKLGQMGDVVTVKDGYARTVADVPAEGETLTLVLHPEHVLLGRIVDADGEGTPVYLDFFRPRVAEQMSSAPAAAASRAATLARLAVSSSGSCCRHSVSIATSSASTWATTKTLP